MLQQFSNNKYDSLSNIANLGYVLICPIFSYKSMKPGITHSEIVGNGYKSITIKLAF